MASFVYSLGIGLKGCTRPGSRIFGGSWDIACAASAGYRERVVSYPQFCDWPIGLKENFEISDWSIENTAVFFFVLFFRERIASKAKLG